jgi:hypothetical protein
MRTHESDTDPKDSLSTRGAFTEMGRNRGFSQPISEKERTSFSTGLSARLSRPGAMTLSIESNLTQTFLSLNPHAFLTQLNSIPPYTYLGEMLDLPKVSPFIRKIPVTSDPDA